MELYLAGYRVDVPEKAISQTFQINDLGDIKDRKVNFTNRFVINETPNNVKAMDYLGVTGNNSRVPYRRISSKLVDDGIELISEGFAIVSKLQHSKGYAVDVQSGNETLYDTLKGRRMNELNYGDLNHLLNLNNYGASLTNNSGYIYGLGYFGQGNVTSVVNVERQTASIFKHTLWDKIFQEAGFTYSGSIFSNADFLNEVVTPIRGYDVTSDPGTETSLGSITGNQVSRHYFGEDDVWFTDVHSITGSSLDNLAIGAGGLLVVGFNGVLECTFNIIHNVISGHATFVVRRNSGAVVYEQIEGYGTTEEKITISVNNGDVLSFELQTLSGTTGDPAFPEFMK